MTLTTIPDAVAHRAVELLVEWQMSEQPELAQQDIEHWRRQHPDHERAWQHMTRVNQQFEQLTGAAAHQALKQPFDRRQILKNLALAALATGITVPAWQSDTTAGLFTPYRTGKGEQGQWTLADGSQLQLNSHSAVRIHFGLQQRQIELLYGEAYIVTGHPPATMTAARQPLSVRTRDGLVTPLGTRFSVHEQPHTIQVQVFEGRVQLQPELGQALELDAGWQAGFNNRQGSTTSPLNQRQPPWTQGMIVANNMRLDDFLDELSRHRNGLLQVDPAVAHLRVSGTYPIDLADVALSQLPRMIPVRIQRFTDLWVRVLPR